MEMESFDALTRQLSEAGASRRLVTRQIAGALFGSALAGVAARLSLTEPAAAKPQHHTAKSNKKRKPRPERQAHGQAHAEGKGKKGKKRRKKSPPSPLPPLPPGCQHCNACQECH